MSDISADCIPQGFDAFSSHCAHNGGYSGVITYVRKETLASRVYYSFERYVLYFPCFFSFLDSLSEHDKSFIYQRYDSDFVKTADMEGRVCFTFFDNCAILNVYFPCGSEYDCFLTSYLLERIQLAVLFVSVFMS